MFNFYSDGILTGYIKQLLHDFNLPKLRLYTKSMAEYFSKYGQEGHNVIKSTKNRPVPYIKDGKIVRYAGHDTTSDCAIWKNLNKSSNPDFPVFYNRGARILNKTKQLQIKNNIYDSYTHEYLGDYLRFLRDFDGIDLMPLYNCFSDRSSVGLKLNMNLSNNRKVSFSSSDSAYKIYEIPVKLFSRYTIAIECAGPIELCCVVKPHNSPITTGFDALARASYKRVNACRFSTPFIYSFLDDYMFFTDTPDSRFDLVDLATQESALKLLLKVPATNKSSIVILEGDYTRYAVKISEKHSTGIYQKVVPTIITLESIKQDIDLVMPSQLQLLQYNTGAHVPFADRLVEYLVGNSITAAFDEIPENVERLQCVTEEYFKRLPAEDGNLVFRYEPIVRGTWDTRLNKILYSFMTTNSTVPLAVQHDILGFVDKDVENYFKAQKVAGKEALSLKNIDIGGES